MKKTWPLLCLLSLGACRWMPEARLNAQKGFLSAQTYDFYQNAPIALNGNWAFYWEAFRDPNQLPWPDPPYYLPVPASWNTRKMPNGRYFPHYGYATYRLRVLLPPKHPPLGLYIPKIWSASKVWVNGQLISRLGELSDRFEGYRNQIVEKVEPIEAKSDTLDLVVQVANFDIFVAGLAQEFRLGAFQKVRENTALAYSWTLMWLGALFLMGLYHLVLFVFRRKQISTLFFGSICLLIGVRQVVFGDHYLYEYLKLHAGWLDFKWQSSIYYITTFALGPLGLAYIRSLYPPNINVWALRIATGITGLYALFILLTPPRVYMPTITGFNAVFLPMILYMVVAIVWAALKKRNETGFLMTGIMVLVVAGLNDIFHQIGWELFGYLELLPLAFALFLSIQFVVLAKRFSRAFRKVEELSANLERKVEERTAELNRKKEEVEHKSEKLERAYAQIHDSVVYASRIQKSILISEEEVVRHFKDGFVLLCPRDIVSGDFYWFAEIRLAPQVANQNIRPWEEDGVKILVAADCTGHGVPGAFMTVMGNDFLNEIVLEKGVVDPAQILYELDAKISQALQKQSMQTQLADGMDLSLIALNQKRGEMIFAGAKNPLYFVREGQLREINGSKFPIGGNHFYKQKTFENQAIVLRPGDRFYMFSDGFQDQFNGKNGRKFMKKRFRETIAQISSLPMSAQKQRLEAILKDWKGDYSQTDDILVMGVEI